MKHKHKKTVMLNSFQHPLHFLHASKVEILKQVQDDKMMRTSRGFTLIELLVVVLIIGILAAVAVPQYQKAVLKSRFTTAKEMARSLANAEEIYYLANGKYTVDFEELDIETSVSKKDEPGDKSFRKYFEWGRCTLSVSRTISVACNLYDSDEKVIIGYQVYGKYGTATYTGQRWCVAYQDSQNLNSLANQVCKGETQKDAPWEKQSGATWKVWVY